MIHADADCAFQLCLLNLNDAVVHWYIENHLQYLQPSGKLEETCQCEVNPADTWRKNNVIITSEQRRFDVIMTLSSRPVPAGESVVWIQIQLCIYLPEYKCPRPTYGRQDLQQLLVILTTTKKF